MEIEKLSEQAINQIIETFQNHLSQTTQVLSSGDRIELIGFVITFIGILITLVFSIMNYRYTKKRQLHEDYLNKVSDYRLKYIDMVREPIAEYLESLDSLMTCDDQTAVECYNNYRSKHYKMITFFTLFSDTDRDVSDRIGKLYNSINMQAMLNKKSRKEITEKIHREIPVLEKALRKLMDDNWCIMKKEIMLQTGRKL